MHLAADNSHFRLRVRTDAAQIAAARVHIGDAAAGILWVSRCSPGDRAHHAFVAALEEPDAAAYDLVELRAVDVREVDVVELIGVFRQPLRRVRAGAKGVAGVETEAGGLLRNVARRSACTLRTAAAPP